ncbi:hypothetical protein HYH03_015719 [Edaphochlamys debaryana]|uniref:Glycosyl transferase CAP10 domain-containing protein n=1 Tax=Edaphochlamys debaryana TaxID=47281 RepID=A0A835XK26_9CHLO|nr:hypothetical protein HYH03_015719 [Edaphochlamys debaryana]|eukprot:KAG2485553.1 hypothetical protein HYH03_015719 [Edaphochlamys debaryana]
MVMNLSIRAVGPHQKKLAGGISLLVQGGKLYAARDVHLNATSRWWADDLLIWLHAVHRIVQRWGPAVPDVELFLDVADWPAQDSADPQLWASQDYWPVLQHCKSSQSVGLTVPTWHFYSYNATAEYFSRTEEFNELYPWDSKLPQAYGGGLKYFRYQGLTDNQRPFEGNLSDALDVEGPKPELRKLFKQFVKEVVQRPDIMYDKGRPMLEWAAFKMTILLDGITCSSKIWQLMALGSVVLREQSNYFAFYDKRLRKFEHFVPFWEHHPSEITWAVDWVHENDAAARNMALRAQAFARNELNAEALECYWLMLLHEYAKLLRFKPGTKRAVSPGGPGENESAGEGAQYYVPMEDWFAEEDEHGNLEKMFKNWPRDEVRRRAGVLELLPAVDMHSTAVRHVQGAAQQQGT